MQNVDDVRPTILAKPHILKNYDEQKNNENRDRAFDVDLKQTLKTVRSGKKDDTLATATRPLNGHTQNTIYQTQQPKADSSTNDNNPKTVPLSSTSNKSNLTVTPTPVTIAQTTTSQAQQVLSQAPVNVPLSVRLNTGPFMSTSIKLFDENLVWQEPLLEFLQDQTDFLVVGIIGKQGVGKSTIMSLLSGNKFTDENRHMIFRPSAKDTRELAQHKTNGIQTFVTAERTILLDVQPLLSSSVLERSINYERKHSNYDFKYYENFTELQSVELACFILSVCDVVLVCEDWFTDPNLFRLIQTAEMLTPNMHTTGTQDDFVEHHPHMVYVLNKSEFLSKTEVDRMKRCIDHLMKDSKLTTKGSLCEFRNHLSRRRVCHADDTNFVLIPKIDGYRHDWHNNALPEFNGMPSLERTIKYMQREILGVKRNSYTSSSVFTEKKWFAYANKVWETIKKSPMISEYNRLMT